MTVANGRAVPALLRHLNGRAVLAALQRHGPLSRAEIVRHTGVSGPTVTRVVAGLLTTGLLEEGDPRPAALGRPGRVVRLASRAVSVLGLAVGARQCELVAAGLDGDVRPDCIRSFATPARYGDLVRAIIRHTRELGLETGTTVLGLGVSLPGLLNRRDGQTVFSPNLHQTDGRCFGEDLKSHLGGEVVVLQESHALCLAEQTYGAARGVADFAMLDISEGLGLGVVLGGRFVQGHSGLAGELGHITVEMDGRRCGCGNYGCLETVATDTALAARIAERLGRPITIEAVVELARSGDLEVGEEFERVLQYLAVGLAAIINVFNPSKLFVHGHFLDAAAHLTDRLLELTRRRALAAPLADCAIVRARGSKPLGAVTGIVHQLTTGRGGPSH